VSVTELGTTAVNITSTTAPSLTAVSESVVTAESGITTTSVTLKLSENAVVNVVVHKFSADGEYDNTYDVGGDIFRDT